jgi:hypothetical protein
MSYNISVYYNICVLKGSPDHGFKDPIATEICSDYAETKAGDVKVFRGIHGFQGQSGIGTWLCRILINACYDLARKRKREADPATDEQTAGPKNHLPLKVALDDALRTRIGRSLRSELSPRHVPDTIEQVRAIPRTLTGKKLEMPVKRILLGVAPEAVASRDALLDPTALDAFAELAPSPDGRRG